MKSKALSLFFLIIVFVFICGCSSSPNWSPVGKWKAADNSIIEFKPDQSYIATYYSTQDEGTWSCTLRPMTTIGNGDCTIYSKNGNQQYFFVNINSDKITNRSSHFEYSRIN